jgi:hypothetical protein
VRVIGNTDGSVQVLLGNNALVDGVQARHLQTTTTSTGRIALKLTTGREPILPVGGSTQTMIDFLNDDLAETKGRLDAVAASLVARVNAIHAGGTLYPSDGTTPAAQAFTSETAVVAVVRSTGEVIDRAVASREFRTVADLFDRLAGANATAPGPSVPVRITIPAGVTAIGLVGVRLEEWKASGRGAYATPKRSIALASNFRLEFTPR